MPEIIINIIGFGGYTTNVIGNLLLAWNKISGWIVRAISIILWGIYAQNINSWPMTVNSITFFIINCVGFYQWRKKQQKEIWLNEQRRHA